MARAPARGPARPPPPATAPRRAPPRRARSRGRCDAARPPHASASDSSRSPRRGGCSRSARRVGGEVEGGHHVVALARARRGRPPSSRAASLGDREPAPPARRRPARPGRAGCAARAAPRGVGAGAQLGPPATVLGRVRDQVAERLGQAPAVGAQLERRRDRAGGVDGGAPGSQRRVDEAPEVHGDPAGRTRRPPRAASRSASPAHEPVELDLHPVHRWPGRGSRRQLWQTSASAVAAPRSSCSAHATRSSRRRRRWTRADRQHQRRQGEERGARASHSASVSR